MLDLINSALAFPVAASFLAAQEMAHAVTQGLRCCSNTSPSEARLYSATETVTAQFGDVTDAIFAVGNSFQHVLVDIVFDAVSGRARQPAWVQDSLHSVLHQTYESWQAIANPRLVLLELQNKYEVYGLVKKCQNLVVPDGPDFPLLQLVNQAYEDPVYTRLWMVEGLGNRYGLHFADHLPVRGLLTEGAAKQLPEKSLLMLHAGIGLAFATVCLKGANPYGCPSALQRKVDEFVELCAANSRDGYIGATHESLGLVTRTFYPEAVGSVDGYLRARYPDMVAYFWHGCGRGLFFYPTYFVPGGPSPWQTAEQETPDEFAYWNAAAGLAWAFTLVNVRQPELLANLLASPDWVLPPHDPMFDGMISSLIMARNVEPDEQYIENCCQFQPDNLSRDTLKNWAELVEPVVANMDHFSQTLRDHERLGEVFRYQDLKSLVADLDSGRSPSPDDYLPK
jgi:hypothetical protein